MSFKFKPADSIITKLPSHSFAIRRYCGFRYCGVLLLLLSWLELDAARAQTTNYALGASALLVGPAAGTNSVVLSVNPATGAWASLQSAPWLKLSEPNQSGVGSTNVVFSFDANPGSTRTGSLN